MPPPGKRPRNQVTARAEIIAEPGPGGTTRLPVLRSEVPLVLRRAFEAVYLVSAAATPLGGDCLELRIEVRAGAALCLRTVAASVALPGLDGGESLLTVTATVAAGGRLEYLPEPVVVADGARHATDIRVSVAEGGSLVLRDELILGRHGERGGAYRGSLRVDYAPASASPGTGRQRRRRGDRRPRDLVRPPRRRHPAPGAPAWWPRAAQR